MPDYRREPRQDNSNLWLILGIVGGGLLLLVLICGGAIYMVTSAMRSGAEAVGDAGKMIAKQVGEMQRAQQAELQARQAACTFLDDCLAGRLNAAYEVTAPGFKKDLTQEQLKDLLARHPVRKRAVNLGEVQTFGLQRYRITAAATRGEVTFTVTMAREPAGWKVAQLAIDGPEEKKAP